MLARKKFVKILLKKMWKKLKQQLGRQLGIIIIAPSVAGLAIAGNLAGVFRLLEWKMYDRLMLMRPEESVEERIAIVTVSEEDIQHLAQWPMSDRQMAQLIRNIQTQEPTAIGIDLYRDLPVEPGHQELVELFQSTPNLIGIEKVAGVPVPPPPILKELGQVAAADLILDADGKLRRSLIVLGNNQGEFLEGLGTKLALIYLQKEAIELEVIDEEKKIYRLGKAVFNPLTGTQGNYFKSETGGYQILLNYRGDLDKFLTISLTDVLENRIPEDFLRDRLVLIGAIAPSLNDFFSTPYSSEKSGRIELTPGVVIHGNIASQILSAALESRLIIQGWERPWGWLWILFWSGYSASLGSISLRHRWAIVAIFLGAGAIVITAYLAFQVGWWIPTVTPLLALTGSAIASIGYIMWDNLKEYALTLEEKVKQRTSQLAQANQEITALNQKLQAENLRLNAELDIAKQLQQMVLPKPAELEIIEGLEIAGYMEPADEVGGDYYDVLPNDSGIKISIGDVTGHGLESGVLMIMAQTAIRTLHESKQTDPVQFLDILNRTLFHNIERMNSEKNMTLALLDYRNGTLSLSGQHEEIIIVRTDGSLEEIDTIDLGFPLGLDENIADFVAERKFSLHSGDVVVLYTDGITEAENTKGVHYGLARLCELVRENRQLAPEEIRQKVVKDVRQHIGSQKVFDDLTLVIIKQK
ncbi:MAG: CHASE2 domain-containing protein [Oscillatoria sp. PMC 1051.18]|nr:CHASE2 domain-containing protein [Oscillatoria sp. PMC 1050.18]MEC5031250.1 CHASE2 domain-containing protein [Oscillatoria sp. PMC 1051.18]